MINNKDCIGITKFIIDNNMFDVNAIRIYNQWILKSNRSYSENDTKWLLDFIKKIVKVDKRLLGQAIAMDMLDFH